MSAPLDAALLDAHARDDRPALVTLYADAAAQATSDTARYFYLTHAYIYALETGHPNADTLHAQLRAAGREA
jgi:hypothetical protein